MHAPVRIGICQCELVRAFGICQDELVGGLYGVKLGRVLFGESMVSLIPDASKAALASLCQESEHHQIRLIDCQVPTSHLESLGASLITRAAFVERINELTI